MHLRRATNIILTLFFTAEPPAFAALFRRQVCPVSCRFRALAWSSPGYQRMNARERSRPEPLWQLYSLVISWARMTISSWESSRSSRSRRDRQKARSRPSARLRPCLTPSCEVPCLFQTFATKLGDTSAKSPFEATVTRYSLDELRQRYVIEGRPLEASPKKSCALTPARERALSWPRLKGGALKTGPKDSGFARCCALKRCSGIRGRMRRGGR